MRPHLRSAFNDGIYNIQIARQSTHLEACEMWVDAVRVGGPHADLIRGILKLQPQLDHARIIFVY